jgi:hypothetical protein
MYEVNIQDLFEKQHPQEKVVAEKKKVRVPSTPRERPSRIIDMTTQTWGYWTVLHMDPANTKEVRWICRCRCGTVKSISGYCLRAGSSKSCGCARHELRNRRTHKPIEIGDLFGDLKVIAKLPPRIDRNSGHKFPVWLCQCQECGRATKVTRDALVTRGQQRCHCARTAAKQYSVGMEIAGTKLLQQAPSSGRPEQGSMWHVLGAGK